MVVSLIFKDGRKEIIPNVAVVYNTDGFYHIMYDRSIAELRTENKMISDIETIVVTQ